MKIFLKHMISSACKLLVEKELIRLGICYHSIELGEIVLKEIPSLFQVTQLKTSLATYGFEIMEDKKIMLVEKVKATIKESIQDSGDRTNKKYSVILSDHFNLNYNYLAKVFSEVEGVTIEKYIISQKAERVKELMKCGKFTITEIVFKMNYSSVAHLSMQFKKATGFTLSDFRESTNKNQTAVKIAMSPDYAVSA